MSPMSRFRIALRKTFPLCSRPVVSALAALLGQESSSDYSLGELQLHTAFRANREVAARRGRNNNTMG